MDVEAFRKHGKEMVDYICTYMQTLPQRRVIPDVLPGYLKPLLPDRAPTKGEEWKAIMEDIEEYIMPGITHWQHPRFHAYFPAGNSYPSIMGDMLSDAIGCVGFSWAASPACAELEMVVLDWLARMMNLPETFMHDSGKGGGVLQGSASDCVLVTMLAARHRKIEEIKARNPDIDEGLILSKLVAYCSSLAHSCVEKAAMISFVKIHQLDVDNKFSVRGDTLEKAIEEDRKKGLIPFYACCTLGTTACCSFDNLKEMGPVCEKECIWFHVDAAYAGSSFICPEFQYLLEGIEATDSMNFNPNKWMLVNFDASVLWVRDREELTRSMVVNPVYLQHKHSSKAVDFRHWGIPLSRRFRSLKLWFVLRTYGVNGLQKYIREHTRLAKIFGELVQSDPRFEMIGVVSMGLACFRLRGINSLTQCLIRSINESGDLHMIPSVVNETYFIRFAVCAENACDEDITIAWQTIQRFADEIIAANNSFLQWRSRIKKFQKVPESDEEEEEEEAEEEEEHKHRKSILNYVDTPSFDMNGPSDEVPWSTLQILDHKRPTKNAIVRRIHSPTRLPQYS